MKKSLGDYITPNIRLLAAPVLILAALIMMSITVLRISASKLAVQKNEIESARTTENILRNKVNVLVNIQNNITAYTQMVSVAVPETNPVLIMISQLKYLAGNKGVTLSNIKAGAETSGQETLKSVDLNFGLDGPIAALLDFLKSLDSLSPLSTLDKVKLSQSIGMARAEVTIKVYYAAFPEKLPSISEPVKEFSADEKEMLNKFGQLKLPVFMKLIPQQPGGRINPFE